MLDSSGTSLHGQGSTASTPEFRPSSRSHVWCESRATLRLELGVPLPRRAVLVDGCRGVAGCKCDARPRSRLLELRALGLLHTYPQMASGEVASACRACVTAYQRFVHEGGLVSLGVPWACVCRIRPKSCATCRGLVSGRVPTHAMPLKPGASNPAAHDGGLLFNLVVRYQ